jgi:Mg/Co/Ni transporter MgtE
MAAGLPTEGTGSQQPRIGAIAHADAPTCTVNERLGDVAERVRAGGWDACVAVNDERVVFGFLREKELKKDPEKRIEEVMRPGPSTFRPFVSATEMAQYMREHDMTRTLVTTSDGRLVGLLRREDVEKAVHAMRADEGHAHG